MSTGQNVLAGRNPTKGHAAEVSVRQRHRNAKARFEAVDLARLESVADFSNRVLAAGRPIDILINNAGIMAPRERKVTADGFELQFGTNYLSHFALTARLLPLLTEGKARVVQLSSVAHRSGKIHFDDLNYERGYKPFPVYGQSKLAMLIFAIELDRRSKLPPPAGAHVVRKDVGNRRQAGSARRAPERLCPDTDVAEDGPERAEPASTRSS